jgi:hypothetical protein
VALLLFSVALFGAAPLEDAERLLHEARFEEVPTALAPLLTSTSATAAERAAGHVLLGIARHNLLDVAAARAAFGDALTIDPTVQLPKGTSPKTAALFNEVRAARPVATTPPPPPALVLTQAPPTPTPATRVAAFIGGGLSLALGGTGAALTAVGLSGRAAAVAEPVGAASALRYDEARLAYAWGTGLLFSAAATLLVSAVLFFLPGAS